MPTVRWTVGKGVCVSAAAAAERASSPAVTMTTPLGGVFVLEIAGDEARTARSRRQPGCRQSGGLSVRACACRRWQPPSEPRRPPLRWFSLGGVILVYATPVCRGRRLPQGYWFRQPLVPRGPSLAPGGPLYGGAEKICLSVAKARVFGVGALHEAPAYVLKVSAYRPLIRHGLWPCHLLPEEKAGRWFAAGCHSSCCADCCYRVWAEQSPAPTNGLSFSFTIRPALPISVTGSGAPRSSRPTVGIDTGRHSSALGGWYCRVRALREAPLRWNTVVFALGRPACPVIPCHKGRNTFLNRRRNKKR